MARPSTASLSTKSKKEVTSKTNETDVAAVSKRKKRKFKSGTVALREIRRYQKSTKHVVNRAACERIFRSIAQDINPDIRFQGEALNVLHEAMEAYVIKVMQQGMHCTANRQSQTLVPKDIKTALAIGCSW